MAYAFVFIFIVLYKFKCFALVKDKIREFELIVNKLNLIKIIGSYFHIETTLKHTYV